MKKILPTIFVFIVVTALGAWWKFSLREEPVVVNNFEECATAGNPIMESYPRKCVHGGLTFTEDIGNELEKYDIIRVSAPKPNTVITNPVTIEGEARGTWFFEASFPIELVDENGSTIASHYIMTAAEWMTNDFVPFSGKLEFDITQVRTKKAKLILHKDNPAALPEYDDALEIPVIIGR